MKGGGGLVGGGGEACGVLRAGRPGWLPAVLVRMLLLGQYGDLSDREVEEQVGYNLLYRAFVGLGVEDAVPDSTTLVRFWERVGEEGMRVVFAAIDEEMEAAGLIGSERRVLDGVHLWAKVARRSWVWLLRRGWTRWCVGRAGARSARCELAMGTYTTFR